MRLEVPVDNTRKMSKVAEMVEDAYTGLSLKEGPRPYIGASIIGHPCDRYIWLNFRWAFYYQLPAAGRIELLFERGKREEEIIVETLMRIGLEPHYVLNEQLDLDFGCHVKGHPDGLVFEGIPEAPKAPHNLEFKTHNDASFKDLVKNGCREAKPMHYAQQQLEMYGEKYINKVADVQRSLYYAVNKNDDDRYTERIDLDKECAELFIARGHRLALEDDIPPRLSSRPDWFQCKMCPFHGFCHGTAADRMLPEISCRTCCHSTPKEDGTWFCEYWKDTIPESAQRRGCDYHVIHPDLVPDWTLMPGKCTDWTACYEGPDGSIIYNGIEGHSTLEIMEGILKEENKSRDYLFERARLEALPDENADIPF